MYNRHEAIRKLNNWKKNLHWIQPYYAVKSNPIAPILDDLSKNGAGFDCASDTEIKLAKKYGLKSDKIVYSNTIKEPKHIQYAKRKGTKLTTADTI